MKSPDGKVFRLCGDADYSGHMMLPDEIIDGWNLSSEDIVFVAGSRFVGLSNKHSDLDVFVIFADGPDGFSTPPIVQPIEVGVFHSMWLRNADLIGSQPRLRGSHSKPMLLSKSKPVMTATA